MDKGFSLKMTSAQATEVTIGQGLSPAGISLLVFWFRDLQLTVLTDRLPCVLSFHTGYNPYEL